MCVYVYIYIYIYIHINMMRNSDTVVRMCQAVFPPSIIGGSHLCHASPGWGK